VRLAFSLALAKAGSRRLAKMAMMAITTNNSISVNPLGGCNVSEIEMETGEPVQGRARRLLQVNELRLGSDFLLLVVFDPLQKPIVVLSELVVG